MGFLLLLLFYYKMYLKFYTILKSLKVCLNTAQSVQLETIHSFNVWVKFLTVNKAKKPKQAQTALNVLNAEIHQYSGRGRVATLC